MLVNISEKAKEKNTVSISRHAKQIFEGNEDAGAPGSFKSREEMMQSLRHRETQWLISLRSRRLTK